MDKICPESSRYCSAVLIDLLLKCRMEAGYSTSHESLIQVAGKVESDLLSNFGFRMSNADSILTWNSTGQLLTLGELLKASREFDNPVYMCFTGYGGIQSLYNHIERCFHILATN